MKDLRYYLALPWTIVPSKRDDDGVYHVLQVSELPGFVVADADEANLGEMFWDALADFLRSYLEEGEEPPLPARRRPSFPELSASGVPVAEEKRAAWRVVDGQWRLEETPEPQAPALVEEEPVPVTA